MKFFFLYLVLTLSFQSLIKADDIRDFQIEEMGIGDSLLNFFTKDKIIFSDYIYKYLLIQIFIIINLFSITYNAYIISYMLLAGLIIYFTNKILRYENQ